LHVVVQLRVAVPVELPVRATVQPPVATVQLPAEPPVPARVPPPLAMVQLLAEPRVPAKAQLLVARTLSVQDHLRNKQPPHSAILHQPAVHALPIQTSRPLQPYSDARHMKNS
jgi:hypothetical protein